MDIALRLDSLNPAKAATIYLQTLDLGTDVSTVNMHQGFTHVSESIFETMDDVKTYSTHPAHLQFADHVMTLTDAILVLDYKPTLDLRIEVVAGVSEQELCVVNFIGLASIVGKRWALFDVAANDLDTFFAYLNLEFKFHISLVLKNSKVNYLNAVSISQQGRDVSTANMHQGFTLVFESIFETMDDVETYSAHLAHLQFSDHAMKLTDAILVLDYKPTMGAEASTPKIPSLLHRRPQIISTTDTCTEISTLRQQYPNYTSEGRDVSTANLHQGFTHMSESILETMDDVETYSAYPAYLQFADHVMTLTDAILVLDYKPTLDLRIEVVVGVSEQELRVVNFMGLASIVDKRWALFDVAANDLDTFFA
ncbi:stress-response A/B barrel domain-containing protein HS1 [Tanacetum coccineum]